MGLFAKKSNSLSWDLVRQALKKEIEKVRSRNLTKLV